jgi:hypothetical protein
MQSEYVNMRVKRSDQERLKKYAQVGEAWSDALTKALNVLDGVHRD